MLLEPGHNELETVALLDFVSKLIHRDGARHRVEYALDDTLVAIHIEQGTDNLGRARRVNLLDVHLNVVQHHVLVQVQDQVVHVIETVAHNNER